MNSAAPRRLTVADLHVAHAPTAPTSQTTSVEQTVSVIRRPAGDSRPAFRRGAEQGAKAEGFRPASEKQVTFLRKLVAERTPTVDPAYTESVIAQGSARVSKAIEKLLALPKVEQAKAAPKTRTNRYAGTCEECGTRVEAEQGTVALADNGKWEVAHLPGDCPVSEFPFPVGSYAVAIDGTTHFFSASHDGLFEQAGDEFYPVKGKARTEQVIALIAADPEAASREYGRQIGTCGRCGRTLTDEVSRAAGIGPVCAKKGW